MSKQILLTVNDWDVEDLLEGFKDQPWCLNIEVLNEHCGLCGSVNLIQLKTQNKEDVQSGSKEDINKDQEGI